MVTLATARPYLRPGSYLTQLVNGGGASRPLATGGRLGFPASFKLSDDGSDPCWRILVEIDPNLAVFGSSHWS